MYCLLELTVLASGFGDVDTSWLANAMVFIGAASASLFYLKGFLRKVPPDHEQWRKISDCDTRCRDISDRHSQLAHSADERLRSMSEKSAASREKIYLRLSAIETKVGSLQTSDEIQMRSINSISAKLDRIIERHGCK